MSLLHTPPNRPTGKSVQLMTTCLCDAFYADGALLAFEKQDDLPDVRALAGRTWELVDFIVHGLGITQWPGHFHAKLTFRRSCHLRGSRSPEAVATLLGSIRGLDVQPIDETAGLIKQHTLEHLDRYLEQAEQSLQRNGAQVHFAFDADSARETVLRIMREHGCGSMVKSKSMLTEEIHLLD